MPKDDYVVEIPTTLGGAQIMEEDAPIQRQPCLWTKVERLELYGRINMAYAYHMEVTNGTKPEYLILDDIDYSALRYFLHQEFIDSRARFYVRQKHDNLTKKWWEKKDRSKYPYKLEDKFIGTPFISARIIVAVPVDDEERKKNRRMKY
jgi:hypothetical protein